MTAVSPVQSNAVPRLIVLNGPPGSGKSVIAQRYADEHPLTFNLDIDRLRDMTGAWRTERHDAGLLARAAALAIARVHLIAGHDVVIPQFLARPTFLEQVEELAGETSADFHEVVLLDGKEAALRRFASRSTSEPLEPAELARMYDDLLALIATRPAAKVLSTVEGEVDRTYAGFLSCLDNERELSNRESKET